MGRIKSLIDRQGEILVSSAGRRAGGRGGSAQEGSAPTLVLVEELHRHEDNGAAVRTLTSKIGKKSKRPPQGPHRPRHHRRRHLESVLGRLVERATDLEAGCTVETKRRKGEHYRYARDADGDLVMHEWAVPDQIQPPAKGAPKKRWTATCGRSSARTPRRSSRSQDLRRAYKAASAEPWVFLRQNANQWVTQDFAAIDKVGWLAGDCGAELRSPPAPAACASASTPPRSGRRPRSPRSGSTRRPSGRGPRRRDPQERAPRRPAPAARRDRRARGHARPVADMVVVFDRNYGGGLIAEQLEEDHGLTVVDHGQGVEFDLASMLFGELVDQHGFDHDGNPDLTAQVLAAVARRSRYGRRWRVETAPRRAAHRRRRRGRDGDQHRAQPARAAPPEIDPTTTASSACDHPQLLIVCLTPRPGGDRRSR
jgi:hypothetical protein